MSYPAGTHLQISPGTTVGGVPPLVITYQWKLDGDNIVGATAVDYETEDPGDLTCVQTVTDDDSNVISRETAIVEITGADVTAPTLSSATIASNGTTLTLVFDETVVVGAGGNGGFDLDASVSGDGVSCTYASGSGSTTLIYTLGETIQSGETCNLDYTQPGNGIEDSAGNDLASITSAAVTNNSSQGGVTYLTEEDCEGTGAPSWWTGTGSGANFDYTAAPIDGSQSFAVLGRTSGQDSYMEYQFPTTATTYWEVYCKLKILTAIPTTSQPIMRVIGSGTTVIANLYMGTAGEIGPYPTGSAGAVTVAVMSPNTVYHVWVRYQKGSGSNTQMSVAFSTDGIRPTSGNNFASVTDGTSTTTPLKLQFRGEDDTTEARSVDMVFDTIKVANDQTIPSFS